ncbi:MAG: alpha/beta hydrolase [Cyanobacteria bacterium REEB459]|nr:alpha/beta hydrolase [Cyanobacteria bacterium REEB459]
MFNRRQALLGLGAVAAATMGGLPALLQAQSSQAAQSELPYRPIKLVTPDKINLAVQDWGNPTKPPIIFIHGFLSNSICWMRQLNSKLGEDFRLVAYDWRGHGASDKPNDARVYQHGPRWAEEVDTVIKGLQLHKPILVGWSMAGEIIGDYLKFKGDANIAGINFVDAGALSYPTQGEETEQRSSAAAALTSMDTFASIASTSAFIRLCTASPLGGEDFANWVAVGNMVPWYVRRFMTSRPQHDLRPLLRQLKVPVLVTHGGKDVVASIEGSRRAATIISDVKLSIYADAGHASFWEASEQYNADLRKFAQQSFSKV